MRYHFSLIAGLTMGLAGCAEILGIEPWDVSSTGGGGASSSTSSETASSSSTSSSSTMSSSMTTMSTGMMTTSGTGGAPPVAVDCGVAGDPVMVDIPSTGDTLCWYLPDGKHPDNTTLAIGGNVDQPTQPDVAMSPFVNAGSSGPCVALMATDKAVVCVLGDLEAATVLTLSPFTQITHYDMCDDVGLPSPRCYGAFHHFTDGGSASSFDTEAGPPTAPWSYQSPTSGLQKVIYSGP